MRRTDGVRVDSASKYKETADEAGGDGGGGDPGAQQEDGRVAPHLRDRATGREVAW
jgi:hypothetical protein